MAHQLVKTALLLSGLFLFNATDTTGQDIDLNKDGLKDYRKSSLTVPQGSKLFQDPDKMFLVTEINGKPYGKNTKNADNNLYALNVLKTEDDESATKYTVEGGYKILFFKDGSRAMFQDDQKRHPYMEDMKSVNAVRDFTLCEMIPNSEKPPEFVNELTIVRNQDNVIVELVNKKGESNKATKIAGLDRSDTEVTFANGEKLFFPAFGKWFKLTQKDGAESEFRINGKDASGKETATRLKSVLILDRP